MIDPIRSPTSNQAEEKLTSQASPDVKPENATQEKDFDNTNSPEKTSESSIALAGSKFTLNSQEPKKPEPITVVVEPGKLPETVDKAVELSAEEMVVEELNQRHAAIHITQSHILTEKPSKRFPKQVDWFLETKESFLQQYENTKIMCSDGKVRTKGRVWLSSPKRRTFDNITFDMSTTGHKGGYYNIWKGFAVSPKKGSCELYKEHIKRNICCGSEEKFDYLWKWMADLVQRPYDIGVAILLMGSQGTGKGIFVNILGRLLGKHYIQLDNLGHVVGNFNNHMKDSVLVFCDEAIWGGNKRDVGRLKSMITEKNKIIEQKCKDPIPTDNFARFIFASNEDWPVHLDRDDRRFFVLAVGDGHKEDVEYFGKIVAEMEAGGYEALLYELLQTDLSNFCLQKVPRNADSFNVKILSASSIDRYVYEALREGSFDLANTQSFNGWLEQIPTRQLYSDYATWCQSQRQNPESQERFGMGLKKVIPSMERRRVRVATGLIYAYCFKPLNKTRKDFEAAYKVGEDTWE